MAFDQTTRNRLARFVGDCRGLLTEEFTRQLQSIYGMNPETAEVADLDSLSLTTTQYETARLLRETLAHYLAGHTKQDKKARIEVLDRIVREQAFTVLNRLCAIRMAESRDLVVACIGQGYQSKSFKLYQQLAKTSLGETGDAYRVFLFSVFDEFAVDLPVLFDRFSPQGRLFPREAALLELLDHVNHAEIVPLWAEDETIGWIYQYFNSVEERREMRAASQAPRNSRELAVRNQFFTPRYVVEFLTDNTLGRIWYEMTKGETSLTDSCRYLVRRPNEIFLAEGEEAPEEKESGEDLSQEQLLEQPVHIPHRPLKDPRDIKMLDPACGSMHFGLYAFDLFERIYNEAWDLGSRLGAEAFVQAEGLNPLHESYDSKAAFVRDVPRLIIERNIHGIDIDPRAAQIAGLSLWLRAQRSWQAQSIAAADRLQIQRSNIVCAEPMPGEENMLEEFLTGLRNTRLESLIRRVLNVPENQQVRATARMAEALCDLVRTVWKEMELAGEAGSLLKIEDSLADAIAIGKEEWEEKFPLFRVREFGLGTAQPKTSYVKSIPGDEDDFWNRAEALVLAALSDYAEQATGHESTRKRIFTSDASKGFAFIDLCRSRFDVALMNPPFGDAAIRSRRYVASAFPDSSTDVGMAFVTRFTAKLTPGGRLGAITNRVFLANDTLSDWRVNYLLGKYSSLSTFIDLGYGVLDDALVEAASYVIERRVASAMPVSFIRVLDERDKLGAVEDYFEKDTRRSRTFTFVRDLADFASVPGAVMTYQLPRPLITRIAEGGQLRSIGGKTAQGLIPSDDFRFVRLVWEVHPHHIGRGKKWTFYAKGGEYNPYWDDIHLVVNWEDDGSQIRNFVDSRGKLKSRPQNIALYYRRGLTYPSRTTSDFCPRVLPQDCIFSAKGQGVFSDNDDESQLLGYLVGSQTRCFKMVVDAFVGSGDASVPGSAAIDYRSGLMQSLPAPIWDTAECHKEDFRAIVRAAASLYGLDETTRYFAGLCLKRTTLAEEAELEAAAKAKATAQMLSGHHAAEHAAAGEMGFSDTNLGTVDTLVGPHPLSYDDDMGDAENGLLSDLWALSESRLMAEAVARCGARRQLTKKSFVADRRLEVVSHTLSRNAIAVSRQLQSQRMLEPDALKSLAHRVVSFGLGVAFGRWGADATFVDPASVLPSDLFQPLPITPPAANQADASQLSAPSGTLSGNTSDTHSVLPAIRQWMRDTWGTDADGLEHDLALALGASSLEAYLDAPTGFFLSHLAQYSKSRRYAPIYWPLSTPSLSYTVWVYYHRLANQTLYTCVNDFVDPKLKQVSEDAGRLRAKPNRSSPEDKEFERLSDFESELKDFRDELLRVAKFWKPNLNDGVQITAAPLWKLFQHRQWQTRLKETWEKLEAGEYDWAHLALSIWPDRVVLASHKDRSYAIAHDLEDQLWHEIEVEKKTRGGKIKKVMEWRPRDLGEQQIDEIVAEVRAR